MQTTGKSCALCGERIVVSAGAVGCARCDQAYHEACLDEVARGRCPRCAVSFELSSRVAELDEREQVASERRRRLTLDQGLILAGQAAAFALLLVFGNRADRELTGSSPLPSLDALEAYRSWDELSGYALVALGLLFLAGLGRAVQRRSPWQVALFALAAPLVFAATALCCRLS